MSVIVKRAAEVMPMAFDFTKRLGGLAAGAKIPVGGIQTLTVTPTGDTNDLDIGIVGDAIIDRVSNLAVQVLARKGRPGLVYKSICRATVEHAGNSYTFEVDLNVLVR